MTDYFASLLGARYVDPAHSRGIPMNLTRRQALATAGATFAGLGFAPPAPVFPFATFRIGAGWRREQRKR